MATKQNSGVVDGSGNPVLDGSGNPIMSGRFPDEDEITARGRARNAAMFRSFANRLTGKKEEAKKAAPAVSAGPAAGTSNLRDPQQTAASKAKPAASKPAASKAKPAAKAKPAIVTKEELAKSGLSLRDYMNKQQGKTRRGGKAPVAAKPATTTSKPAGASGFLDPQSKAQQKAQPSEPATLNKKPPPFEPPVFKFFKSIRERGDADLKSRGMKKGGSVSSASKRADGIAQSGKTRGKVY